MWIARDEDGSLFLYEEKPDKRLSKWVINGEGSYMKLYIHSYPNVKWEDKEPLEVNIIPKAIQSEKCEESKSIDWGQRRYEIAKDAISTIMNNDDFYNVVMSNGSTKGIYSIPENVAMSAVTFADYLIKELRKGE